MKKPPRTAQLLQALESRILVLDGAMGTAIQNLHLTADGFRRPGSRGLQREPGHHPAGRHPRYPRDYLKAGCDIVETNTFGATPLVLDEYGLGARAHEINFAAAQIAREAADRFSTPDKPRFVAGSIGPTTKAISVTGGVTFERSRANFLRPGRGCSKAAPTTFCLRPARTLETSRRALLAIEQLFAETGSAIPVAVSGTIEPMGTMLAGQSVEALLASLAHLDLLYLGLNCATGPEFMTDHIRSLAALSRFRVACVPNAGLPDENGCYLETPEMVSRVLSRFVASGLDQSRRRLLRHPRRARQASSSARSQTSSPREAARHRRARVFRASIISRSPTSSAR